VKTALKALVTVALCVLIVWKGDWSSIWQTLRTANPLLMAVVFIGMLLGVSISAFKWRLILSVHGLHFGFNRLQRYYFTSVFFNNFLPSNIGGDVYRIYQTARHQQSRAPAVVAVLTERLTGIWALVALAAVGGALVQAEGAFKPPWLLPVVLVFGAIAMCPLLFLAVWAPATAWMMEARWCPAKLKKVLALSGDYRQQPAKTLQIIGISFAFHLFTLSWMLVLSYAAGGMSSLPRLVLGAAISNLAALVPVSLNGIGLFDGSFIYVMGDLGMSFDAALMMMLVIRALLIPLSLIGGLFYLKERKTVDLEKLRSGKDGPDEASSS
jgi:uncharacterized membrane protein YbhN (UPF0104 family)